MNEIEQSIIAIQLIQELIVDKCEEKGIFTRVEFEVDLKTRVAKFNDDIAKLQEKMESDDVSTNHSDDDITQHHNLFNPKLGEA